MRQKCERMGNENFRRMNKERIECRGKSRNKIMKIRKIRKIKEKNSRGNIYCIDDDLKRKEQEIQ